MKATEKAWNEYRDACYPSGITPVQESECSQAFFAGCMWTIMQLRNIANDVESEQSGAEQLDALYKQIEASAKPRTGDGKSSHS